MNDFNDTHSVGAAGQDYSEFLRTSAGSVISSREDESARIGAETQWERGALNFSPAGDDGSQCAFDALATNATVDNSPILDHFAAVYQNELVEDRRFINPLVQEIVQLHRLRRRWMKARNSLILQGKALGRALSGGDKDAGSNAFDAALKGSGDPVLEMALAPFVPAIQRFDADMAAIEKQLVRLAKKLPIASFVESVRGLGWSGVAAIVGEAGDLSAYPTVSGVWKRLGLAVIDGERQRKVSNAEAALAHGYSPERRSVVWVLADALAKHQRTWVSKETGEVTKDAGPYGLILESEKAKALAKGWPKVRAEAHGKRVMSKALLKDMTLAWRASRSD